MTEHYLGLPLSRYEVYGTPEGGKEIRWKGEAETFEHAVHKAEEQYGRLEDVTIIGRGEI